MRTQQLSRRQDIAGSHLNLAIAAAARALLLSHSMATDHRKLVAFTLADDLTLRIYKATRLLPASERYGLQSQIRRASVSTATNIVEGCARDSDREHDRYFEMAFGSCREVIYLVDLAARLEMLDPKRSRRSWCFLPAA
jgi:four helix bundle protein